MAEDFELVVDNRRYSGWKSIRVTRSAETLAGSFALGVTDRWADANPWPIIEEDPCRVEIDGEVVIDGYVDKRDPQASAEARTLSYTGKDRSAALVENSLVLDHWTFRKMTFFEFATTIARPWA